MAKPTQDKIDIFKEQMVSYDDFRSMTNSKKNDVVEEYLKFFKTIAELHRNWDSSNLSYLYSVARRVEKKKLANKKPRRDKRSKENLGEKAVSTAQDSSQKAIADLLNNEGSDLIKAVQSYSEQKKDTNLHQSDVKVSLNSLSVALNGSYDGEEVARLLSLASEIISKSSHKLKIEIKITQEEE